MKRGYPFTSGNLNFGYYEYIPKSQSSGGGGGARGPAGPQGPRGDDGPPGPEGPPGPAGRSGPVGPTGPPRPTGATGSTGPKGPQGDAGPAGPTGAAGPQGPKGPQGPIGHRGERGDPGTAAHKGDKGDTGDKGDPGDQGPQGLKGDKGDTGDKGDPGANGRDGAPGQNGATGAEGRQGPQGDQGPPGVRGNQGLQGIRGEKGDPGIQGPKGDDGQTGKTGEQGPRGPQGQTGTFVGTVTGDMNMSNHRLYGLPTPTHDSDAATKKWVTDDFPTKSDVFNGFTLTGPLSLGGHKIYNVKAPTNNNDAANKKYVDDNAGTFKDGVTKTNQVDIREESGTMGVYDDFAFHAGAYSPSIQGNSPQHAIINKNTLENGGLVGLDSLTPSLKLFIKSLQEKKFNVNVSLIVVKGDGVSNTVKHKDPTVNSYVLRNVGNDIQFSVNFTQPLTHGIYTYEFDVISTLAGGFHVMMYGECGGTGYKGTSLYRFWAKDKPTFTPGNSNNAGKMFSFTSQANTRNARIHRGSGKKVHFSGSFRYSGDTIVNHGKPYSINYDTSNMLGRTYEFMVQKLTVDTTPTGAPQGVTSILETLRKDDGSPERRRS